MTNDNDETMDRFGLVGLDSDSRLSGVRIRGPYQSATFGCIGSGSTYYIDPKGDNE